MAEGAGALKHVCQCSPPFFVPADLADVRAGRTASFQGRSL